MRATLLSLTLIATLIAAASGCTCEQSTPRTAIPELDVPTLAASGGGAITIDGKLDEAAWQKAGRTAPFVDLHAFYDAMFADCAVLN